MLPQYLIYFTSFFASLGTFYYAYQTITGQVKPNRVSWFLWATSVLIANLIALNNGVSFTETIPLTVSWLTCYFVFVCSFFNEKAYWKLTAFDYLCGLFSVLSLIIWLVVNNSFLALSLAILSDLFAGLPTLFKTFKEPKTESLSSYLPGFINTLIGILILSNINFYNSGFLIWLTISNALKIFLILRSKTRNVI